VDFRLKGQVCIFDTTWNRCDYADRPQYPGLSPILFPEDATLCDIANRGYATTVRDTQNG
jgi:hypothetical protein